MLSRMNLRSTRQEVSRYTDFNFFTAVGKSSGCLNPLSALRHREIQAGRAGSNPKAQCDSLQSLLPHWDCREGAGKQIFSYMEIPCPISPQIHDQPAERNWPRPHRLTPSSPLKAQLSMAYPQLKSFQLTLSVCA